MLYRSYFNSAVAALLLAAPVLGQAWPTGSPGHSGTGGTPPLLAGQGLFCTGSSISITLTGAAPSSPAALYLATSPATIGFKGGQLLDSPLFLPLSTSPAGDIQLAPSVPGGIPDGIDVYFQVLIQHATPAAPKVFSLSNVVTATTTSACVIPVDSIVAWWPGEGDCLDIAGDHHGHIEGGVTFTVGKVGQTFELDGVDHTVVRIDQTAGLPEGNSPRTVEFWTRIEDDPDDLALAFGYGNEAHNQGFHVFACALGGVVSFSNAGGGFDLGSPLSVQGGLWHHVAATYDGATVTLYVDGAYSVSAGAPGPLQTGLAGATIGGRDAGGSFHAYLKGALDEVTVFSVCLTPEQVKAIYDLQGAGKPHPDKNVRSPK